MVLEPLITALFFNLLFPLLLNYTIGESERPYGVGSEALSRGILGSGEAGVDETPREANASPNEGQSLSPKKTLSKYIFIIMFIHFLCYIIAFIDTPVFPVYICQS